MQRAKHRALARFINQTSTSVNDLAHKIDQLPDSVLDVLGYILELMKKYKYAYPSRVTIGKAVGLNPSTVSEKTGILKDLGILEVKQKNNDSNCYYATPLLNDLLKTPVLYRRFPHLRLFSVVLLTAFTLFNNPSSNVNKIDPTLSLISKRSLLKYSYIKEKDLHCINKKQSVKAEKFTWQESGQCKSKFVKKNSDGRGDKAVNAGKTVPVIIPQRIKDEDSYKSETDTYTKEQRDLKAKEITADPLLEIAKLRRMAEKEDSPFAMINGAEYARKFYTDLANVKEQELIDKLNNVPE